MFESVAAVVQRTDRGAIMPNHVFTISETIVHQDSAGRYSLNDLHRAAGGEDRHQPHRWLRSQQAQDLASELSTTQIRVVETTEGNTGGTFVARELVYAYAMWISPRFHLQVIRAYDALMGYGTPQQFTHGMSVPHLLAAQRQAQRLIDAMAKTQNAATRTMLHAMLGNALALQGIANPPMAELLPGGAA